MPANPIPQVIAQGLKWPNPHDAAFANLALAAARALAQALATKGLRGKVLLRIQCLA